MYPCLNRSSPRIRALATVHHRSPRAGTCCNVFSERGGAGGRWYVAGGTAHCTAVLSLCRGVAGLPQAAFRGRLFKGHTVDLPAGVQGPEFCSTDSTCMQHTNTHHVCADRLRCGCVTGVVFRETVASTGGGGNNGVHAGDGDRFWTTDATFNSVTCWCVLCRRCFGVPWHASVPTWLVRAGSTTRCSRNMTCCHVRMSGFEWQSMYVPLLLCCVSRNWAVTVFAGWRQIHTPVSDVELEAEMSEADK